MSARNGDRARFQKDRKRKMLRRERVREFIRGLQPQPPDATPGITADAVRRDPSRSSE
jgi:hypothetical protein